MRLVLVGVNHRTAPVQLREKLAYRPEEIPAALGHMRAQGVAEALILSTCNRVEWTANLDDAFSPEPMPRESAEIMLQRLLLERPGVTFDELQPHLYVFEGQAAIKHLFRVAASLDSMIVGEPQILGQLKVAFAQAREHGAIGSVLDTVVTRAFNVAKRIRSETEIGHNGVSVGYAAVELAREIFGSLHKKRVLIVGAGKMSEGAAKHLMRAGAAEILLTNRTPERAQELANLFSGEVVRYELFLQRRAEVDIVITSSAAPGYVITREMVRRAIDARKSQPVFLVDIAVPRNIDPAVQELEHAFLYDIDDLQRLASSNLRAREGVAQRAESIITEEVSRLEAKLRERELAPTIVSLQEQLEAIRRDVLTRHRNKLGSLTLEQEEALDAITRGIVNKIAHGPISEMRRQAGQIAGEEPQEAELVSVVRRMFRLRDR
ncbi:MAG TPA: glutamyl-tRNA reductase [Bryobacteraceae bacterium]|nr:glutamyl-tRNA reductase [Bryobacteraceae bacterium]